jgi:hypothetical protein
MPTPLVFTSDVFAILGLRSLYFALEAFRYLKVSLALVLAPGRVEDADPRLAEGRARAELQPVPAARGAGILAAGVLASRLRPVRLA